MNDMLGKLTLKNAMDSMIEAKLFNTHTAMPGKIERYDAATQKVDVKPLVRRKVANVEEEYSLPVVPSVPVQFYNCNGGDTFMTFPLKVGDVGMLMFCENSLDNYLFSSEAGIEVDSGSFRNHNLTDAFFMPGIRPFSDPLKDVSTDDVVIKNIDSKVIIKPNGSVIIEGAKFKFEGTAGELMAILSSMSEKLSTTVVSTMLGPQPLSTAVDFAAIKAQLDNLTA